MKVTRNSTLISILKRLVKPSKVTDSVYNLAPYIREKSIIAFNFINPHFK